MNNDSWISNIFPSDREHVTASYQKSITDKIPFEIECRLLTKNNKIKYVKVKCNTYFDKDGNTLKSFGVVMDITLLKENDLLLEKSVSTKDKLMSILAHDLRSPFHKIIGFTGLLIDNIKNPSFAESERYLNIIYTSSEKTLALLNKLLNWIRYQTTEITFKPDHLSVSDIISDILDLEELLATSKKN